MSDELIEALKSIAESLLSLAAVSKSVAMIPFLLKAILFVLTVLTVLLAIYVGYKVLPPIVRVFGRGLTTIRKKISRR